MSDSASDTKLISDIVTRCPQCNTAFRVTPNQLAIADGVVRCGSCLAVFKAIDYKTTDSEDNASKSQEDQPEPIHEDSLIGDDDPGLELNDDIYDLDTDNKSKKTSLFDRKLQPISQHTRESADESWALDMLADLDEDDIETIKIRRPQPKESSTNIVEQNKNQTKTPTPTKLEKAINKAFEEETSPEESIVLKDASLEDNTDSNKTAISKHGFSFFKRKEKKAKAELRTKPQDQTLSDEKENIDELSFDFDETYETPDLEPLQNTSNERLNQDPDTHTEDKKNDIDEFEALYFEEDEQPTQGDTEAPIFAHPSSKEDEIAYEPIDSMDSPPISDEEIEDAMHSKTGYASEQSDFLSRIQPAPVEMEWYEYERTQRWLWLIGAILFSLALVIQVGVFRFDSLSKSPTYRPYYQTACKLVGCQLPSLIDTKKIRATNLVVRSHPSQANILIIDAILINNASFTQPYPALRLEFSDLNNQLLARRDLQPSDYLRGELSGARQMPANQPVQLSLPIIDPGEAAVNYQLKVVKAKNSPE